MTINGKNGTGARGLRLPPRPTAQQFSPPEATVAPTLEELFTLEGLENFVRIIVEQRAVHLGEASRIIDGWAAQFIERLGEDYGEALGLEARGERLLLLEEEWEEFTRETIAEPYSASLSLRLQPELHPYVLHAPLLFQRQIAAALRTQAPVVYHDLVCRMPGFALSHEELFDINTHRQTAPALRYLTAVAEAARLALEPLSDDKLLSGHAQFLNQLKSPYRHFYEIDRYFELVIEDGERITASGLELAIAHTVARLHLHPEQCEGLPLPDGKILPSPFTADALLHLEAVWARDNSKIFFQQLPALLLEMLEIAAPTLVARLATQLADALDQSLDLEDGTGLRSVASELMQRFPVPCEFPEFDREEVLFRAFSGSEETLDPNRELQPAAVPSVPTERIELLRELHAALLQSQQDATADIRRGKRLSQYVLYRKGARPWEHEVLDEELASLERYLDNALRRKGEIGVRLEAVTSELAVLIPIEEQRLKQGVYRRDPAGQQSFLEHELEFLLEEAGKILPALSRGIAQVRIDSSIIDPILAGQFNTPYHYGHAAEVIRSQLEKRPLHEVQKVFRHAPELVDVVEIDRQFKKGVRPKRIRKLFSHHLVDVVFLRNKHREEGVSYEQLAAEFPQLTTLIVMLKGREQIQQQLERIGAELAAAQAELARRLAPRWNQPDYTPLDRWLLSAQMFELVWEWYLLHVVNPYETPIEGVSVYQQQEHERKRFRFKSWLELELASVLRESQPELFEFLAATRPGSCYGLEKLFDLNWHPNNYTLEYITILAQVLLRTSGHLSDEPLFAEFRKLIELLPSPFGGFADLDRYDLESITEKLFILSDQQQCAFTAEGLRIALSGWVRGQERVFFGNDQLTGFFGVMIFRAVAALDPVAHNKLYLVAVNEDSLELRTARAALEHQFEDAEGPRKVLLARDIDAVSESIQELDLIRYFMEEERRSLERGFM